MGSTINRIAATAPAPGGAAIYLRCHPFDPTAMECHRRAIEGLAVAMGLPEPLLYLDNGVRAADGLPALDRLLRTVAGGRVGTVLAPGPFVFLLGRHRGARRGRPAGAARLPSGRAPGTPSAHAPRGWTEPPARVGRRLPQAGGSRVLLTPSGEGAGGEGDA
ncbi:hypothetical protein EH183_04860 [Streptomyces sp. CB01881]|nr:hypothetical protein EH183_04860 [Streptomyces sp. CB01881]